MLRYCAIVLLALSCVSCGGGGGGGGSGNGGPTEFSLSTQSLSFVSDNRLQAPAFKLVTATVTTTATGTLYIIAQASGTAVASISNLTTSQTGSSAQVRVKDSLDLAPGTYNDTITVRACMNSPTCTSGELRGSPQTVSVTYTVTAPVPQDDLVFPRIALANAASDVILRGVNLSGTTSVQFGGMQAASFAVVSATQITARIPALPAGTHPVLLNGGSIPFTGQLAVANEQTYAAAQLLYPAPQPLAGDPSKPLYDAQRRALYVVLRSEQRDQHRLLKYTFGPSGWSVPQVAMIPGLREVIVGPTGTYLLGAAEDAIVEIDPEALAVNGRYEIRDGNMSFPGIDLFINNLALTNDGYAIATFGCRCGSASAPFYFYSTKTHALTRLGPQEGADFWSVSVSGAHRQQASASADGATVQLGRLYAYDPATGTPRFQNFVQNLRSNNVPALVEMDVKGTRIAMSGTIDPQLYTSPIFTDIYDGNRQLLGRIRDTQGNPPLANFWNVVAPDGGRVHILQLDQGVVANLVTYDISSAAPGPFPQVGPIVSLPTMTLSTDTGVTLSPDGETLFIAAENGLFVQPL